MLDNKRGKEVTVGVIEIGCEFVYACVLSKLLFLALRPEPLTFLLQAAESFFRYFGGIQEKNPFGVLDSCSKDWCAYRSRTHVHDIYSKGGIRFFFFYPIFSFIPWNGIFPLPQQKSKARNKQNRKRDMP